MSTHLLSLADKSAPAEKLKPSPVSTIDLIEVSFFAANNASKISSVIFALNAFLTSGLLNEIKATASFFSYLTVSKSISFSIFITKTIPNN